MAGYLYCIYALVEIKGYKLPPASYESPIYSDNIYQADFELLHGVTANGIKFMSPTARRNKGHEKMKFRK